MFPGRTVAGMMRRGLAAITLVGVLTARAAEPTPTIRLEPFVKGVRSPVHLQHDGTQRLFVVEQEGRIRLVLDGQLQAEPYLDIHERVQAGGECGLLSVAFHPRFAQNGRFFVNYTSPQDGLHTVVAEFHAGPKAPRAAADTEQVLLQFKQPWANHNGGQLAFGPDGMLYIGTGDGGSAGDPLNSGQSLDTWLGKILRLDVDHGTPYAVPPDNPFVARHDARPEIWASGLRNPWRFSFDRLTHRLYAGDVGQGRWEEIDVIEKGGNYGWNILEGSHAHKPDGRPLDNLVGPIKEYGHDLGLSITGGLVYRGKKHPALVGWYLYADYATGRIWGLKFDGDRVTADRELLHSTIHISSFGEDVAGELYVCAYDDPGAVWRIAAGE